MSGSQAGTHIVLCVPIGARGAAHRGSRRIAPAVARRARELPARRPLPSASACGRPRRGPVAAVLPHWSHGDGRLPDGRLTRPLPPPAEGHGREAWCQHWSGTAGGRWGPRLPGQPPSSLVPHALVRTALAIIQRPIGALWVRHADTYPQADTPRSRVRTMRRYGVRPTFSQLVSLRSSRCFQGSELVSLR